MNNVTVIDSRHREQLLMALGEQLHALHASSALVVIGGAALQALELIERPTRDVDIVALAEGRTLVSAEPLPEPLELATARVARDFRLPDRWLNAGPTDLLRLGLPEGFMDRVVTRKYAGALTVHYASRFDQIHFKLYAAVDQGPGRHEVDLRLLAPDRDELLAAARWARTHDPSPGFEQSLRQALRSLGIEDADLAT